LTERLFFALWPHARQREALARIQGELPAGQGRKTHPEDLHITLVFLGDLHLKRRVCAEQVAAGIQASPFVLSLDRFGCFPKAGILWCGASERPQPLLDLLHALREGLLDCGFLPERRRFKPHVTLARRAGPLPARDLGHPVAWPVSEFALVVAQSGERPRYRVEHRWPLLS
jgi:2'-5' RNA ligase